MHKDPASLFASIFIALDAEKPFTQISIIDVTRFSELFLTCVPKIAQWFIIKGDLSAGHMIKSSKWGCEKWNEQPQTCQGLCCVENMFFGWFFQSTWTSFSAGAGRGGVKPREVLEWAVGGGRSASPVCSRERWGALTPRCKVLESLAGLGKSPCALRGDTMAASIVGPCRARSSKWLRPKRPLGEPCCWRSWVLVRAARRTRAAAEAQCHVPAAHYPASPLPGGPALEHPRSR